MTDLALSSLQAAAPSAGASPVKPFWLRPATIAGVLGGHVLLAWLMTAMTVPTIASLDAISMDLVPEGDFFEQQEVTAAEDLPPPPEEAEQPDLAVPPPMVVAPESPPLPAKKEIVEPKKKVVEKKPEADRAKQKREAQAQRRLGSPEGRAQGAGMSQSAYRALLAAAIRQHTPATSSVGEGTATVSFHVTTGGGITGITASGSTPAHAALARRIMASVHAPPPPGGAFFASQPFTFH